MPFAGFAEEDLDRVAEWCWHQWGGAVPRDRVDGGIQGQGWEIYHSTSGSNLWTFGEFNNEEMATLFKLRWVNENL